MPDPSGLSNVNRRLSARVACRLAVSYHGDGQWHPATGMDLSNTGCRLRLGENLARGASLRVRIDYLQVDGPPIRAELDGTLIWSRLEGLSHQAGIQFTSDDENLHRILHALVKPPAPEDPVKADSDPES